jgi:AcrR family transcriptional regulator
LNVRSNRSLARKRAILRSAAAAFRRVGFERASMEDISASLGMTKGSLYYYFRNKQELLYFCQDHSLDVMLAAASQIARLRAPADEKLARVIRAHLDCILDELDGAGAHLEVGALPEERLRRIVEKRDRYEALVRGMIASGVRAGTFEDVDPKLAAMAVLGTLNWAAKWYRPEGPMRPEQISGEFARILVRGLLSREKSEGRSQKSEGRRNAAAPAAALSRGMR